MLDKAQILRDADPEIVAEYIGIPMQRKGSRMSILCPSHPDKHFGNCHLTRYGYHCFSCGASGDVIKMVQEFTDCSFSEALEIVADTCGGADKYNVNSLKQEDIRSFLKPAQRQAIDLKDGPVYKPVFVSDIEDECNEFIENSQLRLRKDVQWSDGIPYYVASELVTASPLTLLHEESPDEYEELLNSKCRDKIEQYKTLLEFLKGLISLPEWSDCQKALSMVPAEELEPIIIENIDFIQSIMTQPTYVDTALVLQANAMWAMDTAPF